MRGPGGVSWCRCWLVGQRKVVLVTHAKSTTRLGEGSNAGFTLEGAAGNEKVEISGKKQCECSSLRRAPAPSKNTECIIGLAPTLGAGSGTGDAGTDPREWKGLWEA